MDREKELRLKVRFFKKEITLYKVLGLFMYEPTPFPRWIADAVDQGFEDRLNGKRDLDEVFGFTPRPGKQFGKSARKLSYAPGVLLGGIQAKRSGRANRHWDV